MDNFLLQTGADIESIIPEQRTFTLSHNSINFLKALGVLDKIEKQRMPAYYNMQVWETEGNSFIQFKEDDNGIMGHTIENSHLQSAVFSKISETDNHGDQKAKIDLKFGDQITKVDRLEGQGLLKVTFKDGSEVYTKLLVGSDGNKSAVKEKMGISTWGWSHKQKAIVCTVQSGVETHTLWQRFLEKGPMALLSMWGNYYSLIWTVDENLYDYLMALDDLNFVDDLNNELFESGKLKIPLIGDNKFSMPPLVSRLCNKRLSFPLNNMNASRYALDNMALIGDAAHSIHPMAGQGLNLGLMDANLLANIVTGALHNGKNFSEYEVLRDYEIASKISNYGVQTGLEVIGELYGTQFEPIKYLRNIGVSLLNNTPFKNGFKKIADGSAGINGEYNWKR
jgi:ubiquinone biosynthesis UbiH/UbiF/VisC/COQ6 family hydroxylase